VGALIFITMKELSIDFIGRGEVRGFLFQQLIKSDTAYLYEVSPPNSLSYYEVFERRINKRYDTITYPSAKAFGLYAWTYHNYEEALDKFKTL
jgi:hypothetical protein